MTVIRRLCVGGFACGTRMPPANPSNFLKLRQKIFASSRGGASSASPVSSLGRLPKLGLAAVGVVAVGAVGCVFLMERRIQAFDLVLHPLTLEWPHSLSWSNPFKSLDVASVRRGWQVYKQVCSACHTLDFRAYRMFIDQFMTEEEAKAEAAEVLVDDTDDEGKPIKRPGSLTDYVPHPYANDKAAKAANNGASPPDLTLITLSRRHHGAEDYLYHLLTGYTEEPPAGMDTGGGKAYNPYFAGGVLAMPQQLFDDGIEYDDGTPATVSQQAKDVSTFLVWAAEPWHDKRKRLAIKVIMLAIPATVILLYYKRSYWTFYKSQKFAWRVVRGREPPTSST